MSRQFQNCLDNLNLAFPHLWNCRDEPVSDVRSRIISVHVEENKDVWCYVNTSKIENIGNQATQGKVVDIETIVKLNVCN